MTLALLLSCATARRTQPIAGPMELSSSEQHGEVVFMRYCNGCHPFGEQGLAPAINNKPLPGFAIRAQVRVGVGAMPSFREDHIDARELDDLVAYIHAMRRNH